MADRSNQELNRKIRMKITQWDGTPHGQILDRMFRNGTSYEGICAYAGIEYPGNASEDQEGEESDE